MTKTIAHRGISAVAPENTPTAFTLAWAHDCDGIELDVQVSRDGKVLVHHDADTARSSGVRREIAATDWAVLRDLDVGSHKEARFAFERIPLLEQVLKLMPTGKAIQIEIKPEIVQMTPVLELLQNVRRDIAVLVLSCDREKLAQVQAALPQIPLLWVIDERQAGAVDEVIAAAKKHRFAGVDVDYRALDRMYVEKIHRAGLLLGAWTVNDPQTARKLRTWEVEMIASDIAHRI